MNFHAQFLDLSKKRSYREQTIILQLKINNKIDLWAERLADHPS